MPSSAVQKVIFKKACDDFSKLIPEIAKLKDSLSKLNKLNKENIEIIKQHMFDNDLDEFSLAGYEFTNKEVERCSFSENKLQEFLEEEENEDLLERYREQYTEKKSTFSIKKPKKRRRKADD